MQKEHYIKVKNTGLNGFTLDRIASWAIWDSKNLRNTKFIDEDKYINKLNPNIVFVGLNFAGIDNDHQNDSTWDSWQNFHSDRRMDRRIFNAFSKTKYEGAYMTDIIKFSATADAKELWAKIKSDKIDMPKQLEWFIEEINALNTDSIELYLMGNDSYYIYTNYFRNHSEFRHIENKIKSYKNIGSASPSNTQWERKLVDILDLKKS